MTISVPAHIPETNREDAEGTYIFPSKESFPIGDLFHARLALIYALSPTHAAQRSAIVQGVAKAWPQYDWSGWWNMEKPSDVESWNTLMHKSNPEDYLMATGSQILATLKELRKHIKHLKTERAQLKALREAFNQMDHPFPPIKKSHKTDMGALRTYLWEESPIGDVVFLSFSDKDYAPKVWSLSESYDGKTDFILENDYNMQYKHVPDTRIVEHFSMSNPYGADAAYTRAPMLYHNPALKVRDYLHFLELASSPNQMFAGASIIVTDDEGIKELGFDGSISPTTAPIAYYVDLNQKAVLVGEIGDLDAIKGDLTKLYDAAKNRLAAMTKKRQVKTPTVSTPIAPPSPEPTSPAPTTVDTIDFVASLKESIKDGKATVSFKMADIEKLSTKKQKEVKDALLVQINQQGQNFSLRLLNQYLKHLKVTAAGRAAQVEKDKELAASAAAGKKKPTPKKTTPKKTTKLKGKKLSSLINKTYSRLGERISVDMLGLPKIFKDSKSAYESAASHEEGVKDMEEAMSAAIQKYKVVSTPKKKVKSFEELVREHVSKITADSVPPISKGLQNWIDENYQMVIDLKEVEDADQALISSPADLLEPDKNLQPLFPDDYGLANKAEVEAFFLDEDQGLPVSIRSALMAGADPSIVLSFSNVKKNPSYKQRAFVYPMSSDNHNHEYYEYGMYRRRNPSAEDAKFKHERVVLELNKAPIDKDVFKYFGGMMNYKPYLAKYKKALKLNVGHKNKKRFTKKFGRMLKAIEKSIKYANDKTVPDLEVRFEEWVDENGAYEFPTKDNPYNRRSYRMHTRYY